MKMDENLKELATEIENLADDYYTDLDPNYVALDRFEDIYYRLENDETQKITDFLNQVIENDNPKFSDKAENLLNEIEEINPNFNQEMGMGW